jgi:uncharacterized protein
MDKVVHFEIPADDVERAKKFYKTIFKWEIQGAPEMDYAIVRTAEVGEDMMPKERGAINGGMMKRSGDIRAPVITINVADIDKTLKSIEKSGGKTVVGKTRVGDMGHSAYFKDTEGNILGLFEYAE